jgi:hypothetical protein
MLLLQVREDKTKAVADAATRPSITASRSGRLPTPKAFRLSLIDMALSASRKWPAVSRPPLAIVRHI